MSNDQARYIAGRCAEVILKAAELRYALAATNLETKGLSDRLTFKERLDAEKMVSKFKQENGYESSPPVVYSYIPE